MFDALEPRCLMSVAYDSSTGTLAIVGTDHADSIIFSEEILHPTGQHVLRLHFNGVNTDYKRGSVKLINISAARAPTPSSLARSTFPLALTAGPAMTRSPAAMQRTPSTGRAEMITSMAARAAIN